MKKYYVIGQCIHEAPRSLECRKVYVATEVDAALAAKDREIAGLRADAERKSIALSNLLALVEGECKSIAEDDCNVLAAHAAMKERT